MRKAFIGPIGDDLPTLVIVLFALFMFFSGIVFAYGLVGEKREAMELNEASLLIAKVFTSEGVLSDEDLNPNSPLMQKADMIAESHNVEYAIYFDSDGNQNVCQINALRYKYILARQSNTGYIFDAIVVCVWRSAG